jgi:hypothetical protein
MIEKSIVNAIGQGQLCHSSLSLHQIIFCDFPKAFIKIETSD